MDWSHIYTGKMAGRNYVPNGTLLFHSPKSPMVYVNGTIIQLQIKEPYRDSQLNELLYVIIVIVFYATALMTLIITQIRRQRREGQEIDYYDEYLQRNQEVKRTCQTAVNMFKKNDKEGQNTQPAAPPEGGQAEGGEEEGELMRPKLYFQREKSPMLESIPDEEPI